MPSANTIIGDVPDMTCSELKTEGNSNINSTSGIDVDSRYQGKRMSHAESSLKGEAHHEKKGGKSNKNPNKIITSKTEVEFNHQSGEIQESKRSSSSILMEESHLGERMSPTGSSPTEEAHHVRTQTFISRDTQNMISGQNICKSDMDMNKIYISMKEAEINHQSGDSQITERSSDVTSIRVEVSHEVQTQTSAGVKIPSKQ